MDVRKTKHEFHEKSWITELAFIDTPWRVKFEQSYRRNMIDSYASKEFLIHDSLPSLKHSISLEYFELKGDHQSRMTAELAFPLMGHSRSPNFLKLEAQHI